MTSRADFNVEDWTAIVNAPFLAALRVVTAEHGGNMREARAIARTYASARAQDHDGLLGTILSTPPALDPLSAPRSPEDVARNAPVLLRHAIALLERTATENELNTYKGFVYGLADAVARVHREGGFLGIGGAEVSEREQAVLDEIVAIFDARQSPPDEPPAGVPIAATSPQDTEGVAAAHPQP
jgi:hypothetical protein